MPKQISVHDRVDFRVNTAEAAETTPASQLTRRRMLGAMAFSATSFAMRPGPESPRQEADDETVASPDYEDTDGHTASSERSGPSELVMRALRRQAVKRTVELITPEETPAVAGHEAAPVAAQPDGGDPTPGAAESLVTDR